MKAHYTVHIEPASTVLPDHRYNLMSRPKRGLDTEEQAERPTKRFRSGPSSVTPMEIGLIGVNQDDLILVRVIGVFLGLLLWLIFGISIH